MATIHNIRRYFAHFGLFRENGGHFEEMWIFAQVNRSTDLYEITNLDWLVCKECGSEFLEQLDNLERNELTLKNGQCCTCCIALAIDSIHSCFSLLIVLVSDTIQLTVTMLIWHTH